MLTIFARNTEGFIEASNARQMHFPAGEAHITGIEELTEVPVAAFITGADADDLIMLAMAADYANKVGDGLTVFMPYLPGARADRGVPFGAEVYANLINAMNLKEVICFDPHSHVMPGLIRRLTILDTVEVIKRAVFNGTVEYTAVISPDAGSRERSNRLANAVGLPVVNASKHRDFTTGKLIDFTVDELPDPEGRYLIVDDLCDGGGTFMGIAKATGLKKEQLDIWISHGVFSGRAPQLTEAFTNIYTTNSHPGNDNPEVAAKVTDLLPFFMEYL